MELGQAEPFRAFDDHQGRIGHIDPDLDDGGGDEDGQIAAGERRHDGVFFGALHATVDQPDPGAEAKPEQSGALFDGGAVDALALLDQRAYPVSLPAVGDMPAERVDDVGNFFVADDAGFNRGSAGGHFIDPADVHLAIMGQSQRARDRGRGHDQQMRRAGGFFGQQKPLRDPEAMLFVDHREAERLIGDLLLEDRVSADKDVDRAVG